MTDPATPAPLRDTQLPGSGGLLLLDSASQYFRAFFGVPDSVKAPDGTPVNAVRGFLDTIAVLVAERRPARLVACWDDDWRPAFRVDAIPSYKAHRIATEVPGTTGIEEVPEALTAQVPIIVDVLAALGVARVGCPGYEADDVIGTLVERESVRRRVLREAGGEPGASVAVGQAEADAGPVEVVTGDRDLFQLVDDDVPVRVLYTARGLKKLDVVDVERLAERYGVTSGQAYADMAALRGDPSDGLPGVAGIGEKTAAGMLARYGDLAGILRARDEGDPGLSPTQRRRLTEAADYLAVAPLVVQVARDAAVPPVPDDVPSAPADAAALDELATRWGLRSSVDRVLEAFASVR
ncbi:5'-3' exonuclease [Oerskovia turbata]|uniref:5'-3' exonuclease n=1 Tax=Oerskovia turbata TaxID=1713 RepID=A0A4Q1KX59_9CELL|nr:5'-3' exonuclease [Oerskovia turbata]RXR25496.1 5'-3' exonuclease [Oerskovia turbata]RXR33864.1 5'-3' exonuclease [Oerskovia turbata]TGJ95750.1 5'-3' exonuclease [Actinotalea fermentans ATCC 43279 = JCM 9966 = DSM 3133]